MTGLKQLGACLLLAAVPGWCAAEQRATEARKAPGQPRSAPLARPPAGGPVRLNNPGNPLQRLLQMTPEERGRAVQRLRPPQQERARQMLERFDRMPPLQRERLMRQLNAFAALPPETQDLLRRQIFAYNHLPEDRVQALGPELRRLARMRDEDRGARLVSGEFKERFSPAEQQLLADLAAHYPFPGR
jgi:hypothetical protein